MSKEVRAFYEYMAGFYDWLADNQAARAAELGVPPSEQLQQHLRERAQEMRGKLEQA